MRRIHREHPTLTVEWTIYPAWPWRIAAADGMTVKMFKSLDAVRRWLDRNGYAFSAETMPTEEHRHQGLTRFIQHCQDMDAAMRARYDRS